MNGRFIDIKLFSQFDAREGSSDHLDLNPHLAALGVGFRDGNLDLLTVVHDSELGSLLRFLGPGGVA